MAPPETRILAPDEAGIAEAAGLIAGGELVAIPTETVYGLAADATNATAVAKIYEAKGRPSFNPLIVHVADLSSAEKIGLFDDNARGLAERFWPGPLTMVVPRRDECGIASLVSAGLDTIALRVPEHPIMRAVLESSGRPLAAPSANASGRISPTQAAHVLSSLGGRIAAVIDGGPTEKGLESTIYDTVDRVILRLGPISRNEMQAVARDEPDPDRVDYVRSPGMMASHYAPAKPLRLDATAAEAGEILVGYGPVEGDLYLGDDPQTAAARLFDLLHQADAAPEPRIAVAPIPGDGLAEAIRDRLRRAAAPR